MITIFTIPKPFIDPHIITIQTNAINSWKRCAPDVEIFLIGNDPGVAEAASRLNVKHFPNVAVSQYGTPILSSAFEIARQNSKFSTLAYANADIIFPALPADIISEIPGRFLALGKRLDVDVKEIINFDDEGGPKRLADLAASTGTIHSAFGIDYFIFGKNEFTDMPPLIVGRVGWDNWMIMYSKQENISVYDLTEYFPIIHQNHFYPSFNTGQERKTNPEARENLRYITRYTYGIDDADYRFDSHGQIKKQLFNLAVLKKKIRFIRDTMFPVRRI